MRPASIIAGLSLLALADPAAAWGDCKFRAERSGTIEVAGAQKIVMRTGAGELEVNGRDGASRISASGTACASSQELLDAMQISVRREGNTAFVETNIPIDKLRDQSNSYAYIDVDVEVPSSLPVEAQDSSGEAELRNLAALDMRDSSGELEIERVKGAVSVLDSSGEVRIREVGSVKLEDSSGDIVIEKVAGVVDIVADSSGDIVVRDAGGKVDVRQDSSGDIRVSDVRGSFDVGIDSSGSIHARNIDGDFTVGSDGSGSITHENVKGRISTPEN
jgi:hypothetical protein